MLIVGVVVLTLRRQKLEAISERDKAERYAAEADAKSRELKETFDQLDDEHKHRERLQAKNAELQAENQTAARQLIQADKLATLGTLVAGVAHDIANPTGLIQGALTSTGAIRTEIQSTIRELLSDDSEEAKALLGQFESQFTNQESAAKDIALAAARIGEINSAIRNQSRVDLAPGIVTLRTLVDECLTITRSRLIGIEVELCFEESAVVQVIRSQFGQVLINLISNAADAIGEVKGKAKGGHIRLSAKVEDKTLREFTIEDSGPGIPEDVREKILEPFLRRRKLVRELGLGCPLSCAFLTFMDSLYPLKTRQTSGSKDGYYP